MNNVHPPFVMSISKYLKPSLYHSIHTKKPSIVCSPKIWAQSILQSGYGRYIVPFLPPRLFYLSLIRMKLNSNEKSKMFRVLCRNGLVLNMWFMIRRYEHQLSMSTMVCLYMMDFAHCKDHDMILYFQSQLQTNQNEILQGGDGGDRINRLLRRCVLYRNTVMMDCIHTITNVYFNKTLGLEGVTKRSIRIPIEIVQYSINTKRVDIFEYLLKKNTYYNRELSSLVDQCVVSNLPGYIGVLNKIHNLKRFYTGLSMVSRMSIPMYLFMARVVKYPDWFHYEYLLDAIQRDDAPRITESMNQYPYSMCMRKHKLIQLSIGKSWYGRMIASHPCRQRRCVAELPDPIIFTPV